MRESEREREREREREIPFHATGIYMIYNCIMYMQVHHIVF